MRGARLALGWRRWCATLALLLAAVAVARAQEETGEAASERSWSLFGDLRARGDHESLGSRDDLTRGRISVRPGVAWNASATLELGAAARVAAGTDDERLIADNEEREGVRLDQAFLRWYAGDSSVLTVGKAPSELWLTPMVWDADLRPVGVAYAHERGVRAFDVLRGRVALYRGDHRFNDDSTIAAVQGIWSIREGARRGAELAVSFVRFDDLERLFATGLRRRNRIANGSPLSDFELLDLQLAGRLPLGRGSFEARLDVVRNLGADDEDEGTRVDFTWVDRPLEFRYELGVAYQRIQADAVVAAFNSDDWWFHSAMRGAGAWLGYRASELWSLRLAGFSERLDGGSDRFERVLLDFELRW